MSLKGDTLAMTTDVQSDSPCMDDESGKIMLVDKLSAEGGFGLQPGFAQRDVLAIGAGKGFREA